MPKRGKLTLLKALPFILLVGGIIGVFCAGMLTYEKFELLKHPGTQLNCDLNPIVACGPVINTPQASAFGFPNPIIGLVGFSAVATTGGAILAGARFRRWYWLSLQAGVTFAVGFVTWLQFETIFRIHALCPFCMVVWAVTIPIFVYTTAYNLREKNIKAPRPLKPICNFIQKHHTDILISWYLIIIGVILQHFGITGKHFSRIMFKRLSALLVLFLLIPAPVAAHGGVEHNTDDAVVTLYQSPLSPIVRDHVKSDFIFADKDENRLKNIPVKLTLTDIHENKPSGDKVIAVQNLKTDNNGILHVRRQFSKPDYYDIDLDFEVNHKPQEAGFLLQVRNPYKNWFSLTYLLVFAAGLSGGLLISKRSKKPTDHKQSKVVDYLTARSKPLT